jgi:hypothetical protein
MASLSPVTVNAAAETGGNSVKCRHAGVKNSLKV